MSAGETGPADERAADRTPSVRTTLALARHGETVWHHDNRYAGGGSDIDLTPRGRAQARQLAAWSLRERPDVIVSSPVRRARETAAPAAEALGQDVLVLDGLREVDFGLAEGRTIEELIDIDAGMVSRFRADPQAHPFPGSEKPEAAAERAAEALRGLAERFPDRRVLVVAHNTLLRLALCRLLGLSVSRYRTVFPRLENAAITEITISSDPDEPAALLSLNVRQETS